MTSLRPLEELPLYEDDNYYSKLHGVNSNEAEFATMDQQLAAQRNAKVAIPKVVNSRIRVQLSRKFTWAEKEDIERDTFDPHLRKLDGKSSVDGLKLTVSPERNHVWAEAPYGARPLYALVADLLATYYVNVFPTAVRTFREYNGE